MTISLGKKSENFGYGGKSTYRWSERHKGGEKSVIGKSSALPS